MTYFFNHEHARDDYAQYDGDVLHGVKLDIERDMIGKVIVMEAGDKGPVFRKRGMRVMFVNHTSKIVPGFVLVEDVVLKERFGFIIGRNIQPKETLGEDDFFSLISEGYVRFNTHRYNTDKKAIVMESDTFFAPDEITDNDNKIYTLYYSVSTFITDENFDIFKRKYFVGSRIFERSEMTYTESIFANVHFGRPDAEIENYFKDDHRFNLTYININSLKGKDPNEIQQLLIENANKNIDKLNSMSDVVRKVAKNIPRSAYGSIGKIASAINIYIIANNSNQ